MNEWDIKSIEWDLTPESVVFEVGGYKGRWAKLIEDKYNPRLYVFEPQVWAYEECRKVLSPKAHIFNYALGVVDDTLTMHEYHTDGCSFVRTTREQGTGMMFEYFAILQTLNVTDIDLMLMNIEGYEFVLLPYLIARNGFSHIKNFMVQFHPFNPSQDQAMHQLYNQMRLTHRLRWDYGSTLSAWERL